MLNIHKIFIYFLIKLKLYLYTQSVQLVLKAYSYIIYDKLNSLITANL